MELRLQKARHLAEVMTFDVVTHEMPTDMCLCVCVCVCACVRAYMCMFTFKVRYVRRWVGGGSD